MKMEIIKHARTCVHAIATGSLGPLDAAKIVLAPGGAQHVKIQRALAVPVVCAAGRAGRRMWGKHVQIRMHRAWGASMEQCG